MRQIKIGNKMIGDGYPVFIIAEAGVNHNGDLEIAKRLIDAALEAGVDAVKFQTFKAEHLVTKSAKQAKYQKKNIGRNETQFDMLKRLELKDSYHGILKAYCEEKGVIFLSAPFSVEDANFLDSLGVDAYKIPSGEINNFPYLKHIAKKGKPMIVSTGMSTMKEVHDSFNIIKESGNADLIFLHCTSNYPAKEDSLNMKAISRMKEEIDALVGYSDHSEGVYADIIATSLGACVIEKHFTLDKDMDGPDHAASLNPEELKEMVFAIRQSEAMLGTDKKLCSQEEIDTRDVARKSIIAKVAMDPGTVISEDLITIKRPGTGIPPTDIHLVLGKTVTKRIEEDTLLSKEYFE